MPNKFDLWPQTVIGTLYTLNLNTYLNRAYEIKKTIPNDYPFPELMYSSGNKKNILYTDSTFKLLKDFIENFVKENTSYKNILIASSWINFGYKHNTQKIHSHQGSVLSGVFYLQTPPKCGDLIIFHKYNSNKTQRISIQEGLLVIFDGDQPHSVERNFNNNPRIALPFNIIFQ